MTTDRTAAPTRSTALADRPAAGGRTPAPPSDAFSTLLGAATPKHDAAPRREERPVRRDDSPRRDDGSRQLERRPQQPKHDEYRKRPVTDATDAPATDAIEESCDPEAPADAPAVPATPALFALQLASPLPPPPATSAAAVTPAGAATTTPAEGEAPALPILSSIVPASVATATATATAPVTGEAATADPAATPATPAVAAVAASTLAAATTTGVTASEQATEGAFTLPENLLKPQTPGAAQATPATPAGQAQGAAATAGQPQTGADAQTSGQPNTPFPAPTVAAGTAAQPTAETPVDAAPVAGAATPTLTAAPVASAATSLPNVERAVPLSRAVATTGTLIHLASERGITHARLNLKPVELGGIEVKLQSTPAGIHAQLVADSPEAARMLSQAGDQLRQQLSDRDVNLLSLDVSTSSDQRNDQPGFSADGFGDDYRPGGYPSGFRGAREETVLMDTPDAADTVLVLPDGVHVDVLA